jgi:drug/metabolite transporter (DMT)-like permease
LTKDASYALLLLAVCLWASSGTISTLAMDEGVSVVELTTFGFIFGTLVLIPLVAILDPKSLKIARKDLPVFIGFSLIAGVLMNLAFFGAINETTVAVTVILNFTYPTMVTIASISVFREKLTNQKLAALPLTFLGCVLVAGSSSFEEGIGASWLGITLALLSAIGSAGYYVWGKKLEEKYSANTVVLYLFGLTAVILVIIANPFSLAKASIPMNGWLLILTLALLPGIVGFIASMLALRSLEASKASIVSSVEPMIAVGIAFVVLSEEVTAIQLVGVVLIVIGIVLLRLGRS